MGGRVRTKTVKKASRRIIEKYKTKLAVSSPTPRNESKKDQFEVSPSNFKKKNENDETTTSQNSPLFANHSSSTIPPRRCSKLSTSKSMKPRTKNLTTSIFKFMVQANFSI